MHAVGYEVPRVLYGVGEASGGGERDGVGAVGEVHGRGWSEGDGARGGVDSECLELGRSGSDGIKKCSRGIDRKSIADFVYGAGDRDGVDEGEDTCSGVDGIGVDIGPVLEVEELSGGIGDDTAGVGAVEGAAGGEG